MKKIVPISERDYEIRNHYDRVGRPVEREVKGLRHLLSKRKTGILSWFKR